jgi:hypothetical protein
MVNVRRFKSKFLMGNYTPGIIWIREGLSEADYQNTFNHEYKHHLFFSKHRYLQPFLSSRFQICYLMMLCAVWVIHPILYLIAAIPLSIICLHEIHVSIQKPSYSLYSLLFFGLALTFLSFMLWYRIALLWMFPQ